MLVELFDTNSDMECIGQVDWQLVPNKHETFQYNNILWKVIDRKLFGEGMKLIAHLYLEQADG